MAMVYLFIGLLFIKSDEQRVLQDIASHQEIIVRAAQQVGLSPRLVASIIYAERYLNYNWEDAVLDDVLAKVGYSSSVGFAQIKVNTAFWIEKELNTPRSEYYLGAEIAVTVKRSTSRAELIEKLKNDSINIRYCCAYLSMVKHRWSKAGVFLRDENETGILASLYSLGVISSDGKERKPHADAAMNKFGTTVQEFYDSFDLLNLFPM